MVEFEVYAAGLRAPEKLLGLDLELGALPAVHYKVDTLHDIVYLESEDPTISLEQIRGIFKKLELNAHFVGPVRTVSKDGTATQLLDP
jgi:hypothetical protein